MNSAKSGTGEVKRHVDYEVVIAANACGSRSQPLASQAQARMTQSLPPFS
jgi:hypothetical protein